MRLDVTPGQGLAVAVVALAAMEGVAYVAHRWVMHGFLWRLHRSHHEPRRGWWEANDWFAVMGAAAAIALIWLGTLTRLGSALTWLGAGVTAYGVVYFAFHDVIVHRRLALGWVPRGRYMKRIVQAHRLHHAVATKAGTVSFGFVYAPPVRALLARLDARGARRAPPRASSFTASSTVRPAAAPAAASAERG